MSGADRRVRPGSARPVLVLLALAAGALPGCYTPQLMRIQTGLDSLRAVVDTMAVRDSVTYRMLLTTQRELAEQRDILLSTRATTGSTTREMFDQMSRLEERLGEVLGRFQQVTQRQSTGQATPGSPGPGNPPGPATPSGNQNLNQLYDQATLDLTQGRYAVAIQGYRDFLRAFPQSELADNARYGVGEGFFAMSRFDSAAVEYEAVVKEHQGGDRVPAALYKLALAQERLNRTNDARKNLEDLVKRFPDSGEAQLARERLGTTRRR